MSGRKMSYLLTVALTVAVMLMLVSAFQCKSVSAAATAKPDPITLTGKWTDSYGNKYLLVAVGGAIVGAVNTEVSGTWWILGTYSATSHTFTFTAHNLNTVSEWATYTGTYSSTSAAGTWFNYLGLSGTFTLTRGW